MSNESALNNLYCMDLSYLDYSQATLVRDDSEGIRNDHYGEFNHTLSFAEISASTNVDSPSPNEYHERHRKKIKTESHVKHPIAGGGLLNKDYYLPSNEENAEDFRAKIASKLVFQSNDVYNHVQVAAIIRSYENIIKKLNSQHQREINFFLDEKRAINQHLAHIEYSHIIKPKKFIPENHGLAKPVAIKATEMHKGTIAKLTLENEELKANVNRLCYISGLWEKYTCNLRVLKSDNDQLTVTLENKKEVISALRHKISILAARNEELETRASIPAPAPEQEK
ncbi:hypothetical protein HDV01_004017 [Terramyces sp. JEL0728]|nr:hypothetical protein HDV01_004017 [Terramyces sp. JEL0728]